MMGILIKTIPITWYRQKRECEFVQGADAYQRGYRTQVRIDACQASAELSE